MQNLFNTVSTSLLRVCYRAAIGVALACMFATQVLGQSANATRGNMPTNRVYAPGLRETPSTPAPDVSPDFHGFELTGTFISDTSTALSGPNSSDVISRYLLNVGALWDLERGIGWSGATAFINFQNIDGRFGDTLVGDFQVFSNIDAQTRSQIPRVWLETHWLDDRLRVKVGKIDGNNEFAYTLFGGEFLNSSMGFSPTIFVLPTYPDPSGGVVLEWKWNEQTLLRGGVFDGSGVTGIHTGSRSIGTLFDGIDNLMTLAQVDRTWGSQESGDDGRLSVGCWYHNGTFQRSASGGVNGTQEGTYGSFLTVDQRLFQEGSCESCRDQGLVAFFQAGFAEESVSQAAQHYGIGLRYTGWFDSRDQDVIGLGLTSVRFSDRWRQDNPGSSAWESSVEWFYRAQVAERHSVTADLQWITNPNGVGQNDQAVVTLRYVFEF